MFRLTVPRLVFGSGSLAAMGHELTRLRVRRPMLISDRGIERAGLIERVTGEAVMAATFLDVPENPTTEGADAALRIFRQSACDGVVALGGGSVLDTAKMVAAAAASGCGSAGDLLGRPEAIRDVAPLLAIPTTVGTGSESSPVAALHDGGGGAAIGTRSPLLVPQVALCDPDLVRTLPPHLLAATAIDALSHCIEGYFAEPANPLIDALALDGIARVVRNASSAILPGGDAARESLMAAAFAGGVAINKGLGPAHAIALVCGDQHHHHGTLIAIALPAVTALIAHHCPIKSAAVAEAMGLVRGDEIAARLRALAGELGLPATFGALGYRVAEPDRLVAAFVNSHFNRTSPYAPTAEEYAALLAAII